MDVPICDVEAAHAESATLEFKAQFDPGSRQDWCELIKDIVAVANSGGGSIIVGLNDDGMPSGYNVGPLLLLDPADLANKIHSYTEEQFSQFEIYEAAKQEKPVAVIRIGGVRIPLIFTSPGTYPTGPSTQKTAFGRGTIYFRHGPKSEPGATADLAVAIERELERTKEFWLSGIVKVVSAPADATVHVVPTNATLTSSQHAAPIRRAENDAAPLFRAVQADKLYPYRQTELVNKLREQLGSIAIGSHDLLCVRRVHATDINPTFTHKAQWAPRQYSDTFLEWLIQQHRADMQFFQKARENYKHGALLRS